MTAPSALGRGLGFPPRVDAGGRLVLADGELNVRESLAILLQTSPGERVGLPTYGAGLGDFLFEPNSPSTHARIAHAIETAVIRFEPRVKVESVDVRSNPDLAEPETAVAVLTYRLVATGAAERLTLALPLNGGDR